MEAEKLNYFKERLMEEKQRLEDELEASERFGLNQTLKDATSEFSAYDNHPADLASETFEREKDLALWNLARVQQQRINEALGLIDSGKYGQCEECGREINLKRLEALPYTNFCVDCQRAEEEQFINRERPIEEEVLTPPFSRTFLDGTENVGIDGEDVWQEVARYGTSDTPSDLSGVNSYGDTFIDSNEDQGIVQEVDAIINYDPDEIPPDPGNPDQRD